MTNLLTPPEVQGKLHAPMQPVGYKEARTAVKDADEQSKWDAFAEQDKDASNPYKLAAGQEPRTTAPEPVNFDAMQGRLEADAAAKANEATSNEYVTQGLSEQAWEAHEALSRPDATPTEQQLGQVAGAVTVSHPQQLQRK